MALRGNLKDFSLPDVFQLVTFSRKTGVLRIKREDGAEGSVWFRDGDVFFAQSNWHAEPLGERLVRAQRVTEQALEKALKIRATEGDGGRRLGTILVDEGYITEKVLEAFVSDQIQDTIFDLMRWDEGDFDFEAMPDVVEEDIGLTVSIENVVMEGSRRLEEWTRIKKKIPSMDVVFKMATAPGEGTFEISLKPMEWQLLLLVDSTRSVADLATETGRTDFEVARIVYGLFSAGLLEFATDEEVERSRAERAEREAKLAQIEKQRRAEAEKRQAAEAKRAQEQREAAAAAQAAKAAEEAAAKAAEEAAAKAAEDAATKAAEDAAAKAAAAQVAAQPPAAAEADAGQTRAPAEEPSFLGGAVAGPTADDAAVLEAFMGAVLEKPVAPKPQPAAQAPSAPHTPAEEPAFMAVEHEESTMPGMAVSSVEDIIPELGVAPVAPVGLPVEPEPVTDLEPFPPTSAPEVGAPAEGTASAAAETEQPAEVESQEAQPFDLFATDALGSVPDILQPLEQSPSYEPAAAEPIPVFEPAPFVEPDIDRGVSANVPGAEDVTVPSAEAQPEGEHDFERDLMSLGLGELPSDLLGEDVGPKLNLPEVTITPTEPEAEPFELLPVSEPMSAFDGSGLTFEAEQPEVAEQTEAAAPSDVAGLPDVVDDIARLQSDLSLPSEMPQPQPEAELDEEPDFSDLLQSLDVDSAVEGEADVQVVETGFDEELLRDEPLATGGVISTDAFLEDIGDIGMGGSLNDELSALTGAGRPARPKASVNKIPEAGSAVLKRDTRVDKETLLKIIDGIQSL